MYKILIVEDDMVIAKTLANHLAKWNYDVRYVTDFKNVDEEFIEFEPQLVLLDIILVLEYKILRETIELKIEVVLDATDT